MQVPAPKLRTSAPDFLQDEATGLQLLRLHHRLHGRRHQVACHLDFVVHGK